MTATFPSSAIGIAAGVGGALFLAYCVYFDRKRRSDPEYKQKIRARRAQNCSESKDKSRGQLPDLKDHDALQRFFMTEIQLGEELLAQGVLEEGVEHLSNAVAVCGQPQQLLQVFQQTLPPQVFQLLIRKLPEVSQRIAGASMGSASDGPSVGALIEEDLE